MNIEIANRLQKLRKEFGYSQEELAEKLGISRQAVSKWERAESSPDTDNLIILARLYNMSLDELLYDNETDEEIRERNKDKEESNKESISLTDDEGQTVKIEDGHLKFVNKDGSVVKLNKKQTVTLSIIDSIILLLTLIAYLIWSLVFDKWYVSWVIWIMMPAVMSIAEAIMKKQITKFVFPCFITSIYCFLGMEFSLWHPYWFLFITIPFFYIIGDKLDVYVFKTKIKEED